MIGAILILIIFSSLSAQNFDIYEFPIELSNKDYSINKIIKGHSGWTFYLDLNSNVVSSQSSKNNFYFAGGFGNNYDSFIDPIGLSVSNLDLYLFDRGQNKVFRFDYSLNLINSLDLSAYFNSSNIVIDDFALDNWGHFYLLSKNNNAIYRGNISGLDNLMFIDLDQQMIDKNCCDKINVNSDGDIALLYPCSKQLAVFNRLGRLQYKLNVSINNPTMITNAKDLWIVINDYGEIEVINKSISKLLLVSLIDNEYLVDFTENNFKILCLTNQRIIEFHLD